MARIASKHLAFPVLTAACPEVQSSVQVHHTVDAQRHGEGFPMSHAEDDSLPSLSTMSELSVEAITEEELSEALQAGKLMRKMFHFASPAMH